MRHVLSVLIFMLLAQFNAALFATDASAIPALLWSDDFESYPLQAFPAAGGWQLLYDGAGAAQQYIDNSHSVSGSKSLRMVGSYCWAGDAFHTLSIPTRAKLEVSIFLDEIVACGCTQYIASFGFWNPNVGTWGTSYGAVSFTCDGFISDDQGTHLLALTPKKWYQLEIELDLTSRTYGVLIDGVRLSSAQPLPSSGVPTGVVLGAVHGVASPTVWFDDVRLLVSDQ